MEKSMKAIAQAKQEGETVQYYIRDLNAWENEMKQKEAALKDEQAQQALPPVRTRLRREKYMKNKKKNNRKRPASTDYQAWENFDPDKADEEMENVAPLSLSLDMKQSEVCKEVQHKGEAQYEKERGNRFVKVERWDDAIACYNRAIHLVKDDAIYYANRGLCYLKKDNLHQAEQDCTEALRLDPTYVKALQRRAAARERLGSLRAASADLVEVLRLEPHNTTAKRQLEGIKQRMGTKGRKAKCSPVSIRSCPSEASRSGAHSATKPQAPQAKMEVQPAPQQTVPKGPKPQVAQMFGVPQASQIKLDLEPTPIKKVEVISEDSIANWRDGVGENVLVIKPVKKPPHLRSKRALKTIPIREIPVGKTIEDLEKPPTRMKIIEMEPAQGDSNNNENKQTNKSAIKETADINNDPIIDGSNGAKVKGKTNYISSYMAINEEFKNMIKSNDNAKAAANDVKMKCDDVNVDSKGLKIKLDDGMIANNPLINESKDTKMKRTNAGIDNNQLKMEPKDIKMKVEDEKIENYSLSIETKDVKMKLNDVGIESKPLKVKNEVTVAPTNSVQFMMGWRNLRGNDSARCDYLSLLEPSAIPRVFANALECAVLSEIIQVLHNNKSALCPRVTDYLKGLARVKRLSALVMFLSADDKELLNNLLVHCKTSENCSDEDIADLKMKYEL